MWIIAYDGTPINLDNCSAIYWDSADLGENRGARWQIIAQMSGGNRCLKVLYSRDGWTLDLAKQYVAKLGEYVKATPIDILIPEHWLRK